MNSNVSIVEDVVFGEGYDSNETLVQALDAIVCDSEVTWKVLKLTSGSGWPEVEFTGPRADLMTMLNDHFGYDWSEMDDLVPAVLINDVRDAIFVDADRYKDGELDAGQFVERLTNLLALLQD